MANEEQIRILKQGVGVWNEWRNRNKSGVVTNLSNTNLSNSDLSGYNLSDTELSGSNLSNTNLSNADLSNANLSLHEPILINEPDHFPKNFGSHKVSRKNFAVLQNTNLSGVNLREANLKNANFSRLNFFEVNFEGVNFSGAILSGVNFYGRNLENLNFFKANLINADLRNAKLTGANLNGAILVRANLEKTNFEGKKFFDVNFSGAKLKQASLKNVDLFGINLIDADLSNTDLEGANLAFSQLINANLENANLNNTYCEGANFTNAILIGTNLSYANLTGTNLTATNINSSNCERANLSRANLSDVNLSGAYLREANFQNANLQNANFQNAKLRDVNFQEANLSSINLTGSILKNPILKGAHLKGVFLNAIDLNKCDLSNAKLINVQALATNFEAAILTGACIKDWNINSETNFENVICDYIYLKEDQQERRPSDPNINFKPGEFAKLVEQSIETVDLIFKDGIDWKAFLTPFQDLRVEYGEQNVSIQAIEKKSDGVFVIRLNVPPKANKAEIESKVKESYVTKLNILEAEKSLLLNENANLNNIVYTLANRPIMNFGQRGSNIGIGHMSGGEIKDNAKVAGKMNVYASEQKQTLSEAADEIQNLLEQLEKTNPDATPEQQKAYVDAAIPPTLKERLRAALQAGSETAIEEFLDNTYVNAGKAVIKGWLEP